MEKVKIINRIFKIYFVIKVKKSKFGHRKDCEWPEGEQKCSSTLSLTLELDGGGW